MGNSVRDISSQVATIYMIHIICSMKYKKKNKRKIKKTLAMFLTGLLEYFFIS